MIPQLPVSEMEEVARRFVKDRDIVMIPNAVDTREFVGSEHSAWSSPIRIATVRRLVPKNGVQYLVESAPLIMEQSPAQVEFWIIGDGYLKPYLQSRAEELGVIEAFKFFGD